MIPDPKTAHHLSSGDSPCHRHGHLRVLPDLSKVGAIYRLPLYDILGLKKRESITFNPKADTLLTPRMTLIVMGSIDETKRLQDRVAAK